MSYTTYDLQVCQHPFAYFELEGVASYRSTTTVIESTLLLPSKSVLFGERQSFRDHADLGREFVGDWPTVIESQFGEECRPAFFRLRNFRDIGAAALLAERRAFPDGSYNFKSKIPCFLISGLP